MKAIMIFIEFNDKDGKVMVNINSIQMFYFDKNFDMTVIVLHDDNEIHVTEDYQQVVKKITTALNEGCAY